MFHTSTCSNILLLAFIILNELTKVFERLELFHPVGPGFLSLEMGEAIPSVYSWPNMKVNVHVFSSAIGTQISC